MQDITRTKCNSIAEGTEGRLIDTRDNKVYWVAKLKDGLCWMTQNLDYDGGGTNSLDGNFTSSDTTGKYYDPGENYCIDGKCNNLSNISYSNGHDAQGNYYNWLAATNGTGTSSVTSGEASGSICPTGWSLPMSGNSVTSTGSFGGLTTAYSIGNNGAKLTQTPLYFVYGGNVDNSYLYYAGSRGYYWSSTANGSTLAYALYFTSSNVNPSLVNTRYIGSSVRCVAR